MEGWTVEKEKYLVYNFVNVYYCVIIELFKLSCHVSAVFQAIF